MNTPNDYSQRIQAVASARNLNADELGAKVDLNQSRVNALWNGKASPEASEFTKLSRAMSVDESVLQNVNAKKLWVRLLGLMQEWRFPELWPKLAKLTGLRDPSNSVEVPDSLIEDLIHGNPIPRYGLQYALLTNDTTAE